jgi:ketosteroid isomerase-like protein
MDNIASVPAFLLLTLLATGTGCKPPPPRDTHDADVRSITEGEVLWVRHWSTRDAERIVAHYSEDAAVMAPNMAPAIGREAILEMVKQLVRDGEFAFTFEAARVDVARSGDYGYVQGSYTLTMTDLSTKKPVTDRGSYLRIYRKQPDGAWKVVQEIRAGGLPAGPAGVAP